MKSILRHFTPRGWLATVGAVVLIGVSVWLELLMPDYTKEITSLLILPGSSIGDLLWAGGKMLLCALASLLVSVLVVAVTGYLAADYSFNVRAKLYDAVESFSMAEINRFSTASLITRSTNDITQVQTIIVFGLMMIVRAPLMAGLAITKITDKSAEWTFSAAIAVVIVIVVLGVCFIFAHPLFQRIQTLTDNINRITRENLTGLRVVRAYNAESYQKNKFESANADITNNNMKAHRIMSIMMPSMMLVMNGLSLIVYWIGAYLIEGAPLAGKAGLFLDMTVFSQYALMVIMAFMMLNMIFIMGPRSMVAAKRINEVIDTPSSISDGKGVEHTDTEGEIEFRNVSFRYPDASDDVLKEISFKAKKGETVAIIGSTGCGKSTLINLIPRFYDATGGEVLVDGVNIREYTLEQLHNKIGYVPQRAVLFAGTINTNVAMGDNGTAGYTQEDVARAVRIAQAKDVVENYPEGYEHPVAQGGSNLSGGQKQRICIARAVCRNPEILIFDDSFSALDYKTDRVLRETLKKETAGTTNIIVAQRIGTIKDADQIIVLDEGRIAGIGKHKDLLDNCTIYREIALSQLGEEELKNV
ncbi:ABC transporter ATP-binding protein [Ruminococcus difficilis]|uniref:ABC transporter ATP-binding protein n=1 Tax=Ruminococcus difficilis TaxID=2763069 RepID=A0A934WTD8_9FIRM|nr:ABC transporter ATP-binding protein [Ruminococcus difficilis]MBK6089541.1 ABC transporter ATP-binding protein [Ruminococcus difficilis]